MLMEAGVPGRNGAAAPRLVMVGPKLEHVSATVQLQWALGIPAPVMLIMMLKKPGLAAMYASQVTDKNIKILK